MRNVMRVFAVTVLALGLAGASSAIPMTFTIELLPENEVPPVISPATGTAVIEFDPDVLGANALRFDITMNNITTPVLFAHIHVGPVDDNGPILTTLFDFCGGGGSPVDCEDGEVEIIGGSFSIGGTADLDQATVDEILAFNAYVNVHTEGNPGGEIRGQFVPEPGTAALMGLGLAWLARRHRRL